MRARGVPRLVSCARRRKRPDHAVAAVQGPRVRGELPPGGAVSRADAGPRPGAEPEGEPARQPDRRGRQPPRAQSAAADVPRQGQVHLHRPALQHRQRGLGLQRPRELAHDEGVVRPRGRPRRPHPPRQVVLHDAAAPEAATGTAGRGRRDLRLHRRQRGAPAPLPHGRGVRGGELRRQHRLAKALRLQRYGRFSLRHARPHSELRAIPGVFLRPQDSPNAGTGSGLQEPGRRPARPLEGAGPIREQTVFGWTIHHHRPQGSGTDCRGRCSPSCWTRA